jgi:hypothetical protein
MRERVTALVRGYRLPTPTAAVPGDDAECVGNVRGVSEVELIDVRIDVREVESEALYVDLDAQDSAAVDAGRARIVRSWEDLKAAIEDLLGEAADAASDECRRTITRRDLQAAASVTVFGDLPRAPE